MKRKGQPREASLRVIPDASRLRVGPAIQEPGRRWREVRRAGGFRGGLPGLNHTQLLHLAPVWASRPFKLAKSGFPRAECSHDAIIFLYLTDTYVPLPIWQEVSKSFTKSAEFNLPNKPVR